ncbi:hypothetical protein ACFO25_06555 [Paenactinomyces guangxiensis]|uniref:Uncharacterized protein n=1 Tax=Paenactinomyces guangxiensis TaxID=1490290 RepID=A0A7W1WP01_9BACL|nr:hypothetical protein [Paenactinomyces guangxiensis]MBA4493288.1 hypothetical protein [Paenactinomyces guangxiensis]MBH8589861.1 hypothetical protein [Paenactinomyces guangxiensis]
MGQRTDEPIHFLDWRADWQQQKESDFFSMLDRAALFVERSTTFREKMRALYLFQQWTGYQRTKDANFRSDPEQIFRIWFLCDYINVRNQRMIERYMKEKNLEDDWEWASALIASYYSIFLAECRTGQYMLQEWCGETPFFHIDPGYWDEKKLQNGYVLARPVKVGVKYIPVGPVIPLQKEQAKQMIDWIEKQLETISIPLRIFMQFLGLGVYRFLFKTDKKEEH